LRARNHLNTARRSDAFCSLVLTNVNIILPSIVVLLASLIQGMTGAGYVILGLPLLALVYDPKMLVPVMTIHSAFLGLAILVQSRQHAEWWRVWRLLIGGVIGLPIGVYLLSVIDVDILRLTMGVIIISFALLLMGTAGWKVRHERVAHLSVGAASGVLNGLIAMSGPPIVLFLTNQAVDKGRLRASMTLFFFLQNLVTIPLFISKGLLGLPELRLSAYLFPALAIGTLLGLYLHRHIPEAIFRRVLLWIMLVAGGLALSAGLKAI
jgi:uncharacterized membrane protein YfcA